MPVFDIGLIASDIDNTLIPRGGAVSGATRRAVALCREKGITFCVATGRWFASAAEAADQLGHEGLMMIVNGACVATTDGDILGEFPMRDEDVRAVYPVIRDCGGMVSSYVRDALYRINTEAMDIRGPEETLTRRGGRIYRRVDGRRDRLESEALENVYKLEVYSKDEAMLARLKRTLTDMGVSVSSAFSTNVEITSPGLGKGHALEWLADRLGVPRKRTMAFGDNTNDMELLASAGVGVAMGNAVDDLKARADIVCGRCEEDGLARFLFENVLEGRE